MDQQEAVIKQFIEAEAKLQQHKADYSAARDALLALAVREPGVTSTIKGGTHTATITYPEKKKWDSQSLIAAYGVQPPLHVKQTLSIDERDYKRLPQSERELLSGCFQTVPGTPDIDIVSHV